MSASRKAAGAVLPTAKSVLAVCAHPDDESFGLGAVLDAFIQAGAEVSLLCLTRGEATTLGANGDAVGDLRAGELAAAAAEIGAGRVELLEHPDGSLGDVQLGQLAAEVAAMACEVGADLLVVFDEGGVSGHPDHQRATEAALAGAPELPVLAWTLPRHVSDALNAEFDTSFAGRPDQDIDVVLAVGRDRQRRAIARHASQSDDNSVLRRRLELLGDTESLRWLRRPPAAAPSPAGSDPAATPGLGRDELTEQWDRRYASADRLFRAEPDPALVELVTPLRAGRAIDLGAGEGRNSLWLAASGWQVTAVDLSRQALSRLEGDAAVRGVSVLTAVGDLCGYLAAAPQTYDLVVLAYVHPEPEQRAGLLEAAVSALGPGGHLFVVAHHRLPRGLEGHFDPSRLYRQEDLHRASRGLEMLRLFRREGDSDIAEAGTDLVLWARRPEDRIRPAS